MIFRHNNKWTNQITNHQNDRVRISGLLDKLQVINLSTHLVMEHLSLLSTKLSVQFEQLTFASVILDVGGRARNKHVRFIQAYLNHIWKNYQKMVVQEGILLTAQIIKQSSCSFQRKPSNPPHKLLCGGQSQICSLKPQVHLFDNESWLSLQVSLWHVYLGYSRWYNIEVYWIRIYVLFRITLNYEIQDLFWFMCQKEPGKYD